MESAPKFSQWLSCSACCGRAVRFWVSRFCCSCCRSTRTWLCGCSVLPSHCSFLLSSHACLFSKPPVISVCSYSFPIWELVLPAFRVRLQTTTGLVPVVSLLYNGICPSFMPLTWPSQPSRLWLSKANTLGNPVCATTSLFGTSLARWCLKSFWGSAGEKYWVCALGRSRGSRSCYYRAACSARRPGLVSSCCWWSTRCCLRCASTAAAWPIRLFSSASNEKLLEMMKPR